jgi:hypothetical protein
MLPDGVLFTFKQSVRTEIFCNDKSAGKSKKLRGMGILQLPNGCVLSVMDDHGKVTRIKGQPQFTMISAGSMDLIPDGPLKAEFVAMTNGTHKEESSNAFVEKYVSTVIRQVSVVDDKVKEHQTYVWIFVGILLLIILCISVALTIIYRFSSRARFKVRTLRRNVADISLKVFNPKHDEVVVAQDDEEIAPAIPRRSWVRVIPKALRRSLTVDDVNMSPNKEHSYANMSDLDEDAERYASSAPIPMYRNVRYHPGIPSRYPIIPRSELADALKFNADRLAEEIERLRRESAETEELCKKVSASKDG